MKRLLAAILFSLFYAIPCNAQFFGAGGSGGTPPDVDAAITDNSSLQIVTGQITSAEIKALVATPKTLVAAAGANTVIDPISLVVVYNFGTTPYATGTGNLELRFNSTPVMVSNILSSTNMLSSANAYSCPSLLTLSDQSTDPTNKAIQLHISSGSEFTAGDGTISYELVYRTVTTNH
jgi:hypothetical protein